MRHQFASLRKQYNLPNSNLVEFQVVNNPNGFTNGGTIYFSIQGQNRLGYNLPSNLEVINYSAGQEIRIILKTDLKYLREDIKSIIISGCITGNPSDLFRIASYEDSNFPYTITLNNNDHLILNGIVSNPNNLPTNPINGMCRAVTSLGKFYRFVVNSVELDNTLPAINGRWHIIGSPSTYVSNLNIYPGANVSLDEIDNDDLLVKPNSYSLDGTPGEVINYWLVNDTPYAIPSGYRVTLNIGINGENKSKLFNGKLKTIFYGYVNLDSGTVDITSTSGNMDYINQPLVYLYGYQPSLVLQKDLPANTAFAIGVYPEFSAFELKGNIVPGDILNLGLGIQAASGEYNPIGEITGDLIFNKGQLKRVVPSNGRSVTVLEGAGIVDSFNFPSREKTVINNLLPNTANQKITINGDGAAFLETDTVEDTEAQRALVGTISGESNPSNWSGYIPITGGSIKVILNYPCDNNGIGLIRADYPDVIAGYNGTFNPFYVNIYLEQQSTGNIYKWANKSCIPNTQQEFNITSLPTTTSSLTLNSSNSYFSLYAPLPSNLSNGLSAGTIPNGNYRVCYTFSYNGSQVTSISHAEADGCIAEAGGTIASLFTRTKYWAESLTSVELVRNLLTSDVFHGQTRKVRIGTIWKSFTYDATNNNSDNGTSIIKLNAVTGAGRFVEDSGVDTSDFVSKTNSQIISAKHTFNTPTTDAPFVIGNNSSNQLVAGLNADKLDGLDSSDFAPIVHTHNLATTSNPGFMSSADFNKLASIDPNATSPVTSVHGRTGAVVAVTGDYSAGQITGLGNSATRDVGTTSNTVAAGNDNRFTDSRNPSGNAGGDLNGTYPNPTLTTTGVIAGTYTSVTVDAKGRVTNGNTNLTLPNNIAYLTERQTWTKAQQSQVITLTSAPTITLDPSLSNRFKVNLTHNTVITIDDSNAQDGDSFGLAIKQGGARTLSISNGKFPNGLQPDLPVLADTITYLGCERYFDVWICSFSGAIFN